MVKQLASILFTLFVLGNAYGQDEVLVWSDEFSVDGAPNSTYWSYDLGAGGWGNGESQSYTNSATNVRVLGGVLIIDAVKSSGTWTSARIKTQTKFNFKYGRIKFSAKLPTGTGTWPATWMLGESISSVGWPSCGEVDVMEHAGKNPGLVHSSLHTPSSNGNTVNTSTKTVSNYNTSFHVYEANWTADKIEFLIDGVSFYTYQPSTKNSSTWPFNANFFIIMNLAMGGTFGGPIDPALSFAEMQVDYVQVYQSFSQIPLQGPSLVDVNQTGIQYQITNLPGATYSWTVPADAQIMSGAGTNAIMVNWGQTEGNVTVNVTSGGGSYQKSIAVTQVAKPQGNSFQINSATTGIQWANNFDNLNTFTIRKQNPLQVDYTIYNKVSVPALTGTVYRTLDLTDHPVLRVKAKSRNKSKTVNMRIDLVDASGYATNQSPVFDFLPLVDDGEYYHYSFDFLNLNQWKSGITNVAKNRINKINLYIDYGILSTLGADSIWVDSVWVQKVPAGVTAPNRPSHLSGSAGSGQLQLSWKDNSSDETGFEISRSASQNGTYALVKSPAVNATSATLTMNAGDPNYFYRIRSLNSAGRSYASNTISAVDFVTGLIDERPGNGLDVYPNPTTGSLFIRRRGADPSSIRICNATGIEVQSRLLMEELTRLDLSGLPTGFYYIQAFNGGSQYVKKIILQ